MDAKPRTWLRIKSKSALIVKRALLAGVLVAANAWAQPEPTATPEPLEAPSVLPAIRARVFEAKVVRRSNSNRTYMFKPKPDELPAEGRIFLLKQEGVPVMALRVLKTYPDTLQFAAKRVRRYNEHQDLQKTEIYFAIEKESDLSVPPQTPQDKSDLKELESEDPSLDGLSPTAPQQGSTPVPTAPVTRTDPPSANEFDKDLDVGSSPPPNSAGDANIPIEELTEDDEDFLALAAEETFPLDPYRQGVYAFLGIHRTNGSTVGSSSYFTGPGIRYALTPARMILFRGALIQDSISFEGGVSVFKILGFETVGDAYSVMPLTGVVRYNLLFGETYTVFGYGGLVKGLITSAGDPTDTAIEALTATNAAIGAGLIIHFGPNWELRADFGLDMIGGGLQLRF